MHLTYPIPTPVPNFPSTRYAPNPQALARESLITDEDVLAVIDARGGQTYEGSVETGLTNRFPFSDLATRQRALANALRSGAVVRTPMGVLRRPPSDND